jgi:hypothetical protein
MVPGAGGPDEGDIVAPRSDDCVVLAAAQGFAKAKIPTVMAEDNCPCLCLTTSASINWPELCSCRIIGRL